MAEQDEEAVPSLSLTPPRTKEAGYLVLPFAHEQFKEFIEGLLGTPQSISRSIRGPFEVEPADIQSLSELLAQRIVQQNAGILAQFTARVTYSDDSTVEVHSVAEVLSYNEVRPVSCRALHLTWEYLVRFADKKVPEKQTITVSYLAGPASVALDEPSVIIVPSEFHMIRPGFISFRIEHTARTWGADLEALLSNYFKALIKPESKAKQWVQKHHGRIALCVSVGFFLLVAAGLLMTTHRFAAARLLELNQTIARQVPGGASTAAFRVLADMIARGAWAQYSFSAIVFLVVAVFVALFLGMWSDDAANTLPPSFILLNRESRKEKEEVLKRQKGRWLSFCGSILLSLFLGVLSNLIFGYLFSS